LFDDSLFDDTESAFFYELSCGPQIVSRHPLPSKNLSKTRNQKTATGNSLLKDLKVKLAFRSGIKGRISVFCFVKMLFPVLV